MRLLRCVLGILLLAETVLATHWAAAAQEEHNLMPVPASVEFKPGRLPLGPSFTVGIEGHSDDRLRSGIQRALRRLEGRTGLEWPGAMQAEASGATLRVVCTGPGKSIPAIDEDESYSLQVSDRQAVLQAGTTVGILRGLETFLQLLAGDHAGYYIPAVSINDVPRFPWRGLLLDVGRHYMPMEVLKRNIDGMAAVKLNVLHWHITEDQGFRIESKKYPKLHQMGSDGLFYTQDEARQIVAYARERGIRVVPEFDMPGHTQSWLVGHPELAAAPGPHEISRKWGIMDAAFDPTRDEVYRLLDGFLGEMAAIFPDAYMHIGGDEVTGKWWDANPKIQEFMQRRGLQDNMALQTYFNQRVQGILKKHGKRMMGWDEILQPDLPKNVVIHSWRGTQAMVEAARRGYDSVLSKPYYIDLLKPASDHYVDVLPAGHGLTDAQLKHILGGEATMWAEWVSPETVDSRIWPRTAAIAERFWSPASVQDVDDMYRRLEAVSLRLEDLGLTHRRNQDVLLRRIADSADIAALRALASVVEPVKEYRRGQQQAATSFTPLTRLVDAANVDSPAARRFATQVNALLHDAPLFQLKRTELQRTLEEWRGVRLALEATGNGAPLMREAAPLAHDLEQMAAAGLEALVYLSSSASPPDGWREARLAMLQFAAQPKGPMESAILPAIRELVFAALEKPQLKTLGPEAWRKLVRSLASPPPPQPAPQH